MTVIGYARVSTDGQDLPAQLDALKKAGATTVYREKVSGVRADRPQLGRVVAALRPGNRVVVTRLDRTGRSVRGLLRLLDDFNKQRIGFRSFGRVVRHDHTAWSTDADSVGRARRV